MDILLVTKDFRSYGIATRLTAEGHRVRVYTGKTNYSFGAGMVEFVAHPLEAIKECVFIIGDGDVGKLIWDTAKTYNKPIIGTSPLTEMMNADVYKETQIAMQLNIPLPTTEILGDVSDLYQKIIDWNPARTIIRYDRDAITIDHQKWMAWAMTSLPLGKKLVLQTPPYGEVADIIGWFDGSKWAEPFLLKTVNDTAIRASMLLALYNRDWLNTLLRPWERWLSRVDYKGPFRIRVSLDSDKPTLLSTYTGIEFPSIYAFLEGLKGSIADFLHAIAFRNCSHYGITTDFMTAITVGTGISNPEGIPILGIDEGNSKHIFLGNVAKTETGPIISKGLPWVFVSTARGRDIDESLGRAYFTGTTVRIPEPNFTRSLHNVYKPWLSKVRGLGYI